MRYETAVCNKVGMVIRIRYGEGYARVRIPLLCFYAFGYMIVGSYCFWVFVFYLLCFVLEGYTPPQPH